MKWIGDEPHEMKAPPADDAVRPQRAKKNLKKWCHGKVGISHIPTVGRRTYGDRFPCRISETPRGRFIQCWHQIECASCGKILDPWPDRKQCPDLFPESA